jgi:lipopolysaccharide transport system ATP-binding protein
MPPAALEVQGLHKQYVLGGQGQATKTFREMIVGAMSAPFRRRHQEGVERTFWALRDIDLRIDVGEVVGIIGRNGAGKSTLLKILARITEPTRGEVRIRGRVSSLLEVGTGFHPELSGRENIFLNGAILGMARRDIQRKFDEIVAFAEIEPFIDTPVKRYSSGMYVRLAFSVAAHLDPEILLVDEVLAVGDARFQKKCLGQIETTSRAGRTVLLVSHNLDSIRKLCARAISLKGGNIVGDGPAAQVVDEYLADAEARSESHVIRLRPSGSDGFSVEKIEVMDAALKPLPSPTTWQPVSFRITYQSPHEMPKGCVVLQIASLAGAPLIVCTTRPDRSVDAPFAAGRHAVVCRFPRFPLAAGRYRIGAALAVPFEGWLSSDLDGGILEVLPSDVYASGLPPRNDRYAVATDYEWLIES